MDNVLGFHAEAQQATASEGLAQGFSVAARARFEPTTLRTIGIESTNEPPRPTNNHGKKTIELCSWQVEQFMLKTVCEG